MIGFALRRRLTGAALAVLLQVLFIAALLLALQPTTTPERLVRELTLILPRLQNIPSPPATRMRPSAPSVPLPAIPPIALPTTIAPIPFTPTPQQLQGLGQSLFGCAPETWSSLTPEQRAHCTRPGEGMSNAPDLARVPDHVQDEAHWDEELLAKRSPPPWQIPCTHTTNADLGHGLLVPMLRLDTNMCGHPPPDDMSKNWKPLN